MDDDGAPDLRQSAGGGRRRLGWAVKIGMVVALAATLLSVTAPGEPVPVLRPRGPVPQLEVGVVGDFSWGIRRGQVDRSVNAMVAAGIRWVRLNMNWAEGEPEAQGELNRELFDRVDYAVRRARAAGVEILMPIADGVPYWASADPAKHQDPSSRRWNKYWRPAENADYAKFVDVVVRRYQARGVHTYEVWNEPNHARFWPSGPDAVEYAGLLAAAYPAIKKADPAATVVLGGISKGDYDYLEQLYAAGAGNHFDVVAAHPYTGSTDPTLCWNQAGTAKPAVDAFCSIEEIRATMVANGDAAKAVWLTEFGWSTTTEAYGVTEADQAAYLTKALEKVRSSYPYVRNAFWYSLRDQVQPGDARDASEAKLGLLRADFSAKPAYAAIRRWVLT